MEWLPDVPNALGSAGALGLLAWWGLRVMRQSAEDRKGASDHLDRERRQHAEVLAERDRIIAERDRQIAALRDRLESERQARWKAEDSAARWRREAGGEL